MKPREPAPPPPPVRLFGGGARPVRYPALTPNKPKLPAGETIPQTEKVEDEQ